MACARPRRWCPSKDTIEGYRARSPRQSCFLLSSSVLTGTGVPSRDALFGGERDTFVVDTPRRAHLDAHASSARAHRPCLPQVARGPTTPGVSPTIATPFAPGARSVRSRNLTTPNSRRRVARRRQSTHRALRRVPRARLLDRRSAKPSRRFVRDDETHAQARSAARGRGGFRQGTRGRNRGRSHRQARRVRKHDQPGRRGPRVRGDVPDKARDRQAALQEDVPPPDAGREDHARAARGRDQSFDQSQETRRAHPRRCCTSTRGKTQSTWSASPGGRSRS